MRAAAGGRQAGSGPLAVGSGCGLNAATWLQVPAAVTAASLMWSVARGASHLVPTHAHTRPVPVPAEELRASQGQGLVAAMRGVPAPFFQEAFEVDQRQLWEELVQVCRAMYRTCTACALRAHYTVSCVACRPCPACPACPACLTNQCNALSLPPIHPTSAGAERGGAAGEPGAAVGAP